MVTELPFTDIRLGRHIDHDPRSRDFPLAVAVAAPVWTDKFNRVIDPRPNPNQTVGNCTMCAEAMMLNSMGNRVLRRVLDMDWAMKTYTYETAHDEFPGAYPPDDTGSSGLAAAKTAIKFGAAQSYEWIFNGAAGVVNAIMTGRTIAVGTHWYNDMFRASGGYHTGLPIVTPTGGIAGGHEWLARGYAARPRLVLGRCWWGSWRDFWIKFDDLDNLLADDGDAHWTKSV